ncbi:MAG: hybrid sensor histidine kinase/response regulator, partial [Anaerolineae bacterium]|nr:hybrid sensor histidine kinase/response regulator [Anaerolineae bacterium]
PDMDGYEVCRRLKAKEETSNIPVIFLSAISETDDIIKGFEVGGVDYVSKPFQSREVVARVNSQLTLAYQRQQIAALREQDQRQLEQLNQMRDRFLHATAHDLKNPLTGVLLYTQKLRMMEASEMHELPDVAAGIEQNARKMQRLITDILDLAQIQIGEMLNIHVVDVVPLLVRSLQEADIHARNKQIQLHLEAPEHRVPLALDAHYFGRVLDNLVNNAVKYTSEGGEVVVSLQETEDRVFISIEDNGIGIPDEDLPHIFEEFYRVRKSTHKKQSGPGLGLSIVAAIVHQHSGEITAESQEGRGSLFTISLPRP